MELQRLPNTWFLFCVFLFLQGNYSNLRNCIQYTDGFLDFSSLINESEYKIYFISLLEIRDLWLPNSFPIHRSEQFLRVWDQLRFIQ